MKTTILGGLLVALATTAASASTVTLAFGAGSTHVPFAGVDANRGGEFLMTGDLGSFSTFCLEYNEAIAQGSYDYSIDMGAIAGGLGGATGGSDPIGAETAELYRQFSGGTTFGPGSTGIGNALSATDFNNALQDAFWYLEEELGTVDFTAATAALSSANFALLNATAQDLIDSVWGTTASVGRVRALNLYDIASGRNRQSVLYIVAVPLPSAGALALAGLFGVAAVRRRRVL